MHLTMYQTLRKFLLRFAVATFFAVLLSSNVFEATAQTTTISFTGSDLAGDGIGTPTSLQFGPDGRLYASQQDGQIFVYTIRRNGIADYEVTKTTPILLVKEKIPNHNDDGTTNSAKKRQVTGLYVTGTGSNPVLYVTSSDSRIGAGGNGSDVNLDTNSGVLSRLTWVGSNINDANGYWDKVDLVRGLPRSEENHSTNGIQLDDSTNILYLAQGGHTNSGAPSNNFAFANEYALSAAILAIDLDKIEAMTIKTSTTLFSGYTYKWVYDLPTLDDPTRSNVNGINNPNTSGYNGADPGDPFGGNDGLNQAKLVVGGPVQIHSGGYRNAYDVVLTSKGRMYTVDNGANQGWGGHPSGEIDYPAEYPGYPGSLPTTGTCTNNYVSGEPGSQGTGPGGDSMVNNENGLHYIRPLQNGEFNYVQNGQVYYGGHPTPIRGNPAGAGLYTKGIHTGPTGSDAYWRNQILSSTNANFATRSLPVDWPPVPTSLANPAECDFRNSGQDDNTIANYGPSTNGIAEYTASNFGGALKGNLLVASYNGHIYRAILSTDGKKVTNCPTPPFNGTSTLGVCSIASASFAYVANSYMLDVTTQGDTSIFPGTVWVAAYGSSSIFVYEPSDYNGGTSQSCVPKPTNDTVDSDGDSYTDKDEADNGSNACSPSNKPADFDQIVESDGFKSSDLNDNDDDQDGILDVNDSFVWDDQNGSTTNLPVTHELFNLTGYGFGSLGFTGLMTNGTTDYMNQFPQDDSLIFGGTAGLFTIPSVTIGNAYGTINTQQNAFQFGVNVGTATGPFTVRTRIEGSFFNGETPGNSRSQGLQMGTGDQRNYLRLVLKDGGFQVVKELADATTVYNFNISNFQSAVLGAEDIDLYFIVNPSAGTVQPAYAVNNGLINLLGTSPISLSGTLLNVVRGTYTINGIPSKLAVGAIATSSGHTTPFVATWDLFYVLKNGAPIIQEPMPDVTVNVNSGDSTVELATVFADEIGISSLTYSATSSNQNIVTTAVSGTTLSLHYIPGAVGTANVTVTAKDIDNLTVSDTFKVTIQEEGNFVLRVNAGGSQFTDSQGQIWIADNYFTSGSTFSKTTAIAGTVDDTLYQTERYGTSVGYAIPVPASGTYSVRLHFAEIYFGVSTTNTNPGQRVFSLAVEGQNAFTNYDMFAGIPSKGIAAVGPATASVHTYGPYTVTDGFLNLSLSSSVNNAKISAIEVLGAAPASNQPPTAVLGADVTKPDSNSVAGENVTLNGSASTDSDGTIVSYNWKVNGTSLAQTTATVSVNLADGTNTITLTVTDDDGATSSADTQIITVQAPSTGQNNQPPTAVLGANQTVPDSNSVGGENVTLDGSASTDNDGTIVSYNWKVNGSSLAQTTATVNLNLADGANTIQLTVTDDDGATSAADTQVITVQAPAGPAPVVNSLTLINATNDTDLFDLTEGIVISLSALSTSDFNVRANTTPNPTGSTKFVLSGTESRSHTENVAPYALFGDSNGNYDAWTPALGSYTLVVTAYTGSSGGGTASTPLTIHFTVVNSIPNVPPTAVLGADATLPDTNSLAGESTTLDGSASSDTDGTIAAYHWTVNGSPLAQTTATVSVNLPDGVNTITLTVTDDDGATSAADTQIITVQAPPAPNVPPTAVLGADATLPDTNSLAGESTTLNGSASSDSDGTIAAYHWTVNGSPLVETTATVNVNLPDGVNTISLTVTDDDGATSDADTQIITVQAPPLPNVPPTAVLGADVTLPDTNSLAGESTTLNGSASSDTDGTITAYHWTVNGSPLVETTATVSVNLPDGVNTISLTVTDDDGATSAADTQMITVQAPPPPNVPPTAVLGADATLPDTNGLAGESTTLNGSASSDTDGTITAYHWTVNGSPLVETTATVNANLPDGVNTIALTVTDDDGATSAADTQIITVQAPPPPNVPPTAVLGADLTIFDTDSLAGESTTLDGSASSDTDGTIAAYHWTVNGSPLVETTATVSLSLPNGVNTIALTVTDDDGATSAADTQIINVQPPTSGNQPPTTLLGEDLTIFDSDGLAGENVPLQDLTSTDPDGTIVSYHWFVNGSPLLQTTGSVTLNLPDGVNTIQLIVMDDDGATSAADTQIITVVAPIVVNQPPTAVLGADLTVFDTDGLAGENTTLVGTASSDSDGTIVAYHWMVNGSPLVETTATVNLNLPDGVNTIVLTVTDDDGATSAADTQIITVQAPPLPNQPPTAVLGADLTVFDTNGLAGENTTLVGTASSDTDGTIAAYHWMVNGSPLAQTTATVNLNLPDGVNTIVLTVTDDDGATSAADTQIITVQAPPLPNQPPTAVLGADLTVFDTDSLAGENTTLVGTASSDTDGTIVAYNWTLNGSSLAQTTATVNLSLPDGVNTIVLTVTDDDGATSAADTQIITVSAPVVAGQGKATLSITPSGGLGASTYSNGSFIVTNNAPPSSGVRIASISINLTSAILPDIVFDPIGTGGDDTASCLNADSNAAQVGLTTPNGGAINSGNPACTVPYSIPHNGGFKQMSIAFNNFDPGETFTFSTDIDPNSIQGVPGAGAAGSVSGYELVGSTVTVTFSDGSTYSASLFENGNLSSGVTTVAANTPAAPTISVVGVSTSPATVNSLNQTILVTGTPGASVKLLVMDSRLYIATGEPPFDVTAEELPYYANEAMNGKSIITATIESDGDVIVPVTLFQTAGSSGTPNGGINRILAMVNNGTQSGLTSNLIVLKYVSGGSSGPVVNSLALVNASNNTDLLNLTNGMTINLASLASNQLNIKANTTPTPTGSVKLVLTGAESRTQTENQLPYVLFGDNNGIYNAWTPSLGAYTLVATPYTGSNGSGTAGTPLTINFTVTNDSGGPTCGSGGLTQEGEAAVLNGLFAVGNDGAASGGKYIHVPDGTSISGSSKTSFAEFCFPISSTGNYLLQAAVYGNNANSDSFSATINGINYVWDIPISSTFVSTPIGNRGGPAPIVLSLTAGQQLKVIIRLREDGAKVDKITLEATNSAPAVRVSSDGVITIDALAAPAPIQTLSGIITPEQTTLVWEHSVEATWYLVWVGSADYTQEFHYEWHEATELGCLDEYFCTLTLPGGVVEDPGSYTWFVKAWGPGGYSITAEDGWSQGSFSTP